MSYDVAVWEGERPSTDTEAAQVFESLWEQYDGADTAPSPRILGYVSALIDRYPDIDDLPEDALDASPWADSPLTANVMGPFFYFGMRFGAAEEALPFIAATARAHGLVCFDPQEERLLG